MNMSSKNIDQNFLRFVGWSQNSSSTTKFFSQNTINLISKKISELTKGIRRDNKIIIVPDYQISQVMDSVFKNYRPQTGDIYSRYIIPNSVSSDINYLIDQVIEIITNHIINEYSMIENNNKLSAWVQVYGDFNVHNLTQTPPIKIRQKRPDVMQFNMNY